MTEEEQQQQEMENARLKREAEQLRIEMERAKIPDIQEQARIDRARIERAKDLAEGRARGTEQFGDGSLGRLSAESLDNLRKNSKGFTAEEQNAMRDNNLSTINQNNSSQLRQLKIQQAQSGVRGGQAVAQRAKAMSDQTGQVAANERELFLKNIDARRVGQSALIDSEKYTNEQKNREKMAQMTTELGFGALGSADRAAAIQAIIGKQQAAAAANSGGGGGGKK